MMGLKAKASLPGISRKVITVGASDDQKSVDIHGDIVSNYSGEDLQGLVSKA